MIVLYISPAIAEFLWWFNVLLEIKIMGDTNIRTPV